MQQQQQDKQQPLNILWTLNLIILKNRVCFYIQNDYEWVLFTLDVQSQTK